MSETLIDLAEANKHLEEMTPEQRTLIGVMQGHVTLQDQFNQLTKHIEGIYTRIKALESLVHSKVLS